jgi:hypothetical protein
MAISKTSPLTTRQYSPSTLTTATFLPSLFTLINHAYKDVVIRDHERLAAPSQIPLELGEEAFTFITFDAAGKPMATGSAEPMTCSSLHGFEGQLSNDFRRSVEGKWMLVLVASDPDVRDANPGLAKTLVDLIETEVVRKRGKKLLIMAVRNRMEVYWEKRGFRNVMVKEMGIGWWDSKVPFEVVLMEKDLDLR